MAEQDERQQTTEPDAPETGQSRTGRAVALARLLHHESTVLLQLYKEKEIFLMDHTPSDTGRMVALPADAGEPSTEEQVQLLHRALRQCLGLIRCVILKEEEQWGELQGDYETMRKTVRVRLEHLLYTTKGLVETEGTTLDVTPEHQCSEEVDGAEGVFGLKLWTYRVLLELIHWADHAAQTLHVLHKERAGTEEI